MLEGAGSAGELRAMRPGRILEVTVEHGDEVREGDGLVIMEALKMENELRCAFAARIGRVAVEKGQTVEVGQLLCVLEPLGERPGSSRDKWPDPVPRAERNQR